MNNFRVAVLANLKSNAPGFDGMHFDQWDDLDSETTIHALVDAFRSAGHVSEFLEGNMSLLHTLDKFKPDICFNLCEGHFGDAREAQIPALLEMLRIPYTGSKVLTLALTLDKPMTKRVLTYHDLPTPQFQVFERTSDELDEDMAFPMFVKPSREGTGIGVSEKSIVRDEDELREQISHVIETYRQPALVEKYIEGRELTVGVVGNLEGPAARRLPAQNHPDLVEAGLLFLPPLEVDLEPFRNTDRIYSNRLKVEIARDLNYLVPAPIEDSLVEKLNWLTAAVFRVTGSLDVARVDFRLDIHDDLKPYVLEINPIPGLAPGISDLVLEAKAAGIQHAELVNMILNAGLRRHRLIE